MRSSCPRFDRFRLAPGVVFLCFGLFACGSATSGQATSGQPTSGPPTSRQPTSARESGASSSSKARVERTLELNGRRRFSYRVDCRQDKDCASAWVRVDCCGSMRALGVRAGEKRALERSVEQSETFQGTCECLASPTLVDDGSEAEDIDGITARCEENQCTTRLETNRP